MNADKSRVSFRHNIPVLNRWFIIIAILLADLPLARGRTPQHYGRERTQGTNKSPTGGLFAPFVLFRGQYANGNQVSVKDANNHQTDYEYDALNRRTVVRFPLVTGDTARKEQRTVYDGFGRRSLEYDEAGVVTGFGYDLLGRLTSVTNDWQAVYAAGATPIVTRYAYDEVGNQISQTDALGRVTRFEYDKLGRRTHRILPGGSLAAPGNKLE